MQTQHARPTTFARPTPTAAPGSPPPTPSPTPFCELRPTVRPFPAGRGYRSAPSHRATFFHNERRRTAATLFAFLRSYIIYTRARRGTFPPLGGRGSVRPAVEKRKGGEKRTGRWTFSPLCGKDCGKQIVDKWKIGALFPPLRNERRRSGERCPSSGAPNRESAVRSTPKPLTRWRKQALKREKRSPCQRKSPHTGTATRHPTAKTQRLSTKKGRREPETSGRKAKNSCAPRTITTRGASRRARIFSKTKPFAAANEEK